MAVRPLTRLGFSNSTTEALAPYQLRNGYVILKNLKTFANLLYTKGNDRKILDLVKKINPDIRLLGDDGIAFFGDLPIHMVTRSVVRGNINLETFKEVIKTLANTSRDPVSVYINQKTYNGDYSIGPFNEFGEDDTVLHLISMYDDFSDWEGSGLKDEGIINHLIEISRFLISLGADKSFSDGQDFTPYECVGITMDMCGNNGTLWKSLREILKLDRIKLN